MTTVLTILLFIGGIIIWCFIEYRLRKQRLSELTRGRAGLSICQFARSFDRRAVDTKIIRAVYEGIQKEAGLKGFPVLAADDITAVYGIVDDDLDYLADELAEKTKRSFRNAENNPLYGQVTTVRDLVLFLNHQPKVDD